MSILVYSSKVFYYFSFDIQVIRRLLWMFKAWKRSKSVLFKGSILIELCCSLTFFESWKQFKDSVASLPLSQICCQRFLNL